MPGLYETIAALTAKAEGLEGQVAEERRARQETAAASDRAVDEERQARQDASREAADARL